MYVLFELGARWGADKPLIPLLAPGTDAGDLAGPINDLNALSADSAAQIHKLVSDVATALRIVAARPEAYQRQLDRLLAVKPAVVDDPAAGGEVNGASLRRLPSADPVIAKLMDETKQLLSAAASGDGTIMRLRTHGGLTVQVNNRNFVEGPRNQRVEAKWDSAVRQLEHFELIFDPGGRGEVLRIPDIALAT